MFCPSCGLEERQLNQFCRACGADLRPVRNALERPDNITQSAVSARDEIGRAIAAKIREFNSTKELAKVAEEVLPEIEKFLESPEEKRLRRIRNGIMVASIWHRRGNWFFNSQRFNGRCRRFFCSRVRRSNFICRVELDF